MNTAAAIAFTLAMALGFTGLTGLVYINRSRTQPAAPDDPLDADLWPPPATVYDATVAELGDPQHIDFTTHPLAW